MFQSLHVVVFCFCLFFFVCFLFDAFDLALLSPVQKLRSEADVSIRNSEKYSPNFSSRKSKEAPAGPQWGEAVPLCPLSESLQ